MAFLTRTRRAASCLLCEPAGYGGGPDAAAAAAAAAATGTWAEAAAAGCWLAPGRGVRACGSLQSSQSGTTAHGYISYPCVLLLKGLAGIQTAKLGTELGKLALQPSKEGAF